MNFTKNYFEDGKSLTVDQNKMKTVCKMEFTFL